MSDDAPRCSLNLSPKVLAYSPIYSSSHSNPLHMYQYITALFYLMLSLSFVVTKMFFEVLPSMKYVCMPYF